MVLGILTSIAACPAIVGTNEAVMQGQKQNARERHRGMKSNLIVNCATSSRYATIVNGAGVVLQNSKVFLRAHIYIPQTTILTHFPTSFISRRPALKKKTTTPSQVTSSPTRTKTGADKAKASSRPSWTTRRS